MMNLQQVKEAIDRLTPEELRELRAYLAERETMPPAQHDLPPEERARRLDEAFIKMREGLTSEQLEEIVAAMNEEYIEPWDESEWTD
jgi:DNA-binding GntR family transcriptional regulator